MIKFDISGDKQILRKLKRLGSRGAKMAITRSARVAMKPVLAQARTNAPKGKTGNLRKSLRLRTLRRNRRGNIGVLVVSNDQWFVGDQFYAAFQEFGWHIGKRASSLRSRGKWSGIGGKEDKRKWREGEHYLEEAYRTRGDHALQTFLHEVPMQIERIAKGG